MNRNFALMIVFIAFMGTLILAVNIQLVKASGTIYIRADGSIDPSTALVSTMDNVTYILTGNITSEADGIAIMRNNIIVDGAGYTVQGIGGGGGFSLSSVNNITIKNTNIKRFGIGVYIYSSSYNTISGNNITSTNEEGVYLWYSSNNMISGNNITNNGEGIELSESSNNTIVGNDIINNSAGILLFYSSSNNTIYHNNLVNNTKQVDIQGSVNAWDDCIGEGNYWSDYEEKYPNGTEIDGIWDTPYVIDENNRDNYPIVPEFSSLLIPLLFMIATILAVIIYRKHVPDFSNF